MKSMPTVQSVMTPMPHTVAPGDAVVRVRSLMNQLHLRHFPVLDGGKLVGIITDRDIAVASWFDNALTTTVGEVMMPMTYTVRPDAPLHSVALEMSQHKYGSAIVQDNSGNVVGIFTAVDALRVLSDVLKENYPGK